MLSETEIDSLLVSYRGLFYSFAKKYNSFPADDLVQEAMVAVWKELKKYDGVLPVDMVIKKRAKWRMAAIACGQSNWTSEFRSTSNYRQHYHVFPVDPQDIIEEDQEAAKQLEDVEYTAHRDDIVRAMQVSLTPKQQKYLVMKKMVQHSVKDLKEEFGYVPDNLLSEVSRDRLRSELSHLESMVK
jgi:RNA polymerase sigma factor (sigma-70 family)